jgi:hypothetical protein
MLSKGKRHGKVTEVQIQRTWQHFLPGTLLAVKSGPVEWPGLGGHVLVHSDRSMKLRYINPNLAAVVSVPAGPYASCTAVNV